MFSDLELPQPIFSKPELLLIRKCIENNDWPLTHKEKVNCLIKYIKNMFQPFSDKLSSQIDEVCGKIIKISEKASEKDFFNEVTTVLSDKKVEERS